MLFSDSPFSDYITVLLSHYDFEYANSLSNSACKISFYAEAAVSLEITDNGCNTNMVSVVILYKNGKFCEMIKRYFEHEKRWLI